MARYLRAFCTTDEPPTLGALIADCAARGTTFALDPDGAAPDDPAWTDATLLHGSPPVPFPLEVSRADDPAAPDEPLNTFHGEIEEFLEVLADGRRSAGRRKVEAHLGAARFTVAVHLLSSFTDASYDALGDLVRSFTERQGAMIQVDGEGFYDGTKVIVRDR